jgi:hypothetical protein
LCSLSQVLLDEGLESLVPAFVSLQVFTVAALADLPDAALDARVGLRPLQLRKLRLALARRLEAQERAVRRASVAVTSQGTGLRLNAARLAEAGVATGSSVFKVWSGAFPLVSLFCNARISRACLSGSTCASAFTCNVLPPSPRCT